jgi:hypothetical protein
VLKVKAYSREGGGGVKLFVMKSTCQHKIGTVLQFVNLASAGGVARSDKVPGCALSV